MKNLKPSIFALLILLSLLPFESHGGGKRCFLALDGLSNVEILFPIVVDGQLNEIADLAEGPKTPQRVPRLLRILENMLLLFPEEVFKPKLDELRGKILSLEEKDQDPSIIQTLHDIATIVESR